MCFQGFKKLLSTLIFWKWPLERRRGAKTWWSNVGTSSLVRSRADDWMYEIVEEYSNVNSKARITELKDVLAQITFVNLR